MPLARPLNNASSTLAAPHLIGSGTLVLKSGDGARFGEPTVDNPVRVTVWRKTGQTREQITSETTTTIFLCTGRTGDTLTGVTPIEGTDDHEYNRLDPVSSTITAGTILEIQEVAASGTPDAVLTTEEYDDPTWLTGVAAEKIAGTLAESSLPDSGVTPATVGIPVAATVDQYGRITAVESDVNFAWDRETKRQNVRGTIAGRATGATITLTATITNVSLTSSTVTVTTSSAHGFLPADIAVISGLSTTTLNGTYVVVKAPTATTFTCTRYLEDITSTPDSGSAVVTRIAAVHEICDTNGIRHAWFDKGGGLTLQKDLPSLPERWGDNASLSIRQSYNNGNVGGMVALGIWDVDWLEDELPTKPNMSLQAYFLDDGSFASGRSFLISQDRSKFDSRISDMGGQTMVGSSCDINAPAIKAQNQLNLEDALYRYCYACLDAADTDPHYPAGGRYSDRGIGKCKWVCGPKGEMLWGYYLNPNEDDSDPELHRFAKFWFNPATNNLTVECTGQVASTGYLDIAAPASGAAVLRLGSRGVQSAVFFGSVASTTGLGQIGLGDTPVFNFYNNPAGLPGVSVAIGVDDNTSALTVDGGINYVGVNVFTARGKAGQVGDLIRAQSSAQVNLWRVDKNGFAITAKNTAIPDADLASGECATWWDSTNGAARQRFKGKSANGTVVAGALAPVLSVTATLDFGSVVAQTSADLTVSCAGAVVGDSVSIGLPASPDANTSFFGWVSAADVVTVRFNNYSSAPVDPPSGTYRVTVTRI